jgi:hypothetical protein
MMNQLSIFVVSLLAGATEALRATQQIEPAPATLRIGIDANRDGRVDSSAAYCMSGGDSTLLDSFFLGVYEAEGWSRPGVVGWYANAC